MNLFRNRKFREGIAGNGPVRTYWTMRILVFYLFVAIFAPLLANEEPLLLIRNGKWSMPAFQSDAYIILNRDGKDVKLRRAEVNWRDIDADFKLFAPVPYDPASSDMFNADYVSPFSGQWKESEDAPQREALTWRYRHWLGTTKSGADVLAGIIYGTRLSLMIGFASMAIAGLIGLISGGLAGYFGDRGLRVNKSSLILSAFLIVPAWYYIFIFPERSIDIGMSTDVDTEGSFLFLKTVLFSFILLFPFMAKKKVGFMRPAGQTLLIPLDSIISRTIELFLSIPRLILIIILAAIARPSVISLILILGFTSWTGIARIVRGEFIRLRSEGFADAAQAMGFSPARRIFRHLLPNSFAPVRVALIFGIAGAILSEAGLTFLGIGLEPGTVSWGSLMAMGKEQFSAWWLVLFPGLSLSVLLLALNRLAEMSPVNKAMHE
jgi:peptide/nickel transport system permease protein